MVKADTYFVDEKASYVVVASAVCAIGWGVINAIFIKNVDMDDVAVIRDAIAEGQAAKKRTDEEAVNAGDDSGEEAADADEVLGKLRQVGDLITTGAIQFLNQEYLYLGIFATLFAVVLGVTVDCQEMTRDDQPTGLPYTAFAFLIGAGTSILAGYIGMRIAVYTNTRTTFRCCEGEGTGAEKDLSAGFLVAFRGGQVLGFCLVGLALLVLQVIIVVYKASWWDAALDQKLKSLPTKTGKADEDQKNAAAAELVRRLFELVAGYGLGGSTVALFGRVGGGIYTKAADVGADLVGKTCKDLEEDDINNPGTIADNVGDNVGDIAGMGADLFGSLAESSCAALVVSSTSYELLLNADALYFPLIITSVGIWASFLSVLCAHLFRITVDTVGSALKWQLFISTALMTGLLAAAIPVFMTIDPKVNANGDICFAKLDQTGNDNCKDGMKTGPWWLYGCVMFGLWSGMIIGFITEYYTSQSYSPTRRLVTSCKNGPAPNIIQGLALGYMSTIIPIVCITVTIAFAFTVAGMYGIGLAALGMLGSLPVALTIDGYGPISDNAGGVAEMCGLPSHIRDRTDALDAAGNTTAAVGKGFAIGSACLVGLALFGAFVTRIKGKSVDILQPTQFSGLLLGAMLPYAFSALTMTAVGDAAEEMMNFIIDDFDKGQIEIQKGGKYEPDYKGCIAISTQASLRKMIAPGCLVILSPVLLGVFFGPAAVEGLLAGAIVSGVQVAISASNTGGAWDNCKKDIEKDRSAFRGRMAEIGISKKQLKGLADTLREMEFNNQQDTDLYKKYKAANDEFTTIKELHVAAVVGDTVGDPLKDTSGPAINILIKLSAITSLVFGSYLDKVNLFGPGCKYDWCKK